MPAHNPGCTCVRKDTEWGKCTCEEDAELVPVTYHWEGLFGKHKMTINVPKNELSEWTGKPKTDKEG